MEPTKKLSPLTLSLILSLQTTPLPKTQPGGWECPKSIPEKKVIDFDEFLATGDDDFDWPEIDERSALALCYTSGTTGNPKGVAYSHRSTFLHSMACMSTDIMSVSGADSVLPIVPMFHALAWCTPFTGFCLG